MFFKKTVHMKHEEKESDDYIVIVIYTNWLYCFVWVVQIDKIKRDDKNQTKIYNPNKK